MVHNQVKWNTALLVLIVTFLISGCNSGQKNSDDEVKQKVIERSNDTTATRIVKMNETLFSVPSPYQAAIFISKQEIPYNSNILNDIHNTKNYNSTFYRAGNLGVYGADMAYITLYEQAPDAMNYFSVIKGLAEKLQLMGAFDKATVKRLENNIENQDSLLYILSNTYRDVDAYLKNNEQEHLACMVIAGGWIESMYLLTHLGDQKNKMLKTRVGENKKPLDNLVKLLAPYNNRNEIYKKLTEKLIDLATLYENVQVEYKYIEADTDPEKRLTKVKSETSVEMTTETLVKIKKMISDLRTIIVKS